MQAYEVSLKAFREAKAAKDADEPMQGTREDLATTIGEDPEAIASAVAAIAVANVIVTSSDMSMSMSLVVDDESRFLGSFGSNNNNIRL